MVRRCALVTLVVMLLISSTGCATLRNTKIPTAFSEVGLCVKCKRLMALDGLSDGIACACPNCGQPFVVKDAKIVFKRRCVDLKNRKTAMSCLAVGMTAASIAGSMYGIPIPPAPVDEETFKPYELPMLIECRQALPRPPEQASAPADGAEPAQSAEPAPLTAETVETAEAR